MVSFRWCRFSEMFDWSTHSGYLYLPSWVREIGAMMQLLPLLLVPFVGVIQSCRYFLNGQGPLHERINLLYRPSYEAYTNRWVKYTDKETDEFWDIFMIWKINSGLVWFDLGSRAVLWKKSLGPIMSNFWGPVFYVFMGKKWI